ncbi:MAG TPA: 3-deoxy-7-phosphoheptulonate synthase, partial [Bacteroidetes bacterium]|nr:3-deoxy-7-phosphoheptulonate synthase [Bacteroidota bacterium]
ADGLMIEVHAHPEKALSDGYQSLSSKTFLTMMKQLKKYEVILERSIA